MTLLRLTRTKERDIKNDKYNLFLFMFLQRVSSSQSIHDPQVGTSLLSNMSTWGIVPTRVEDLDLCKFPHDVGRFPSITSLWPHIWPSQLQLHLPSLSVAILYLLTHL